MEYSLKFRIYPNKKQEVQIAQTLGCARFVYNHFLALKKEKYETEGKSLSYSDCSRELTALKNTEAYIYGCRMSTLQRFSSLCGILIRHIRISFEV